MLPQSQRIPRALFPLLADRAKVFKNNLFLLRVAYFKDQPKDNSSRFSFSVSKKVAKSAVVRNRLRRTGYSLLGPHISNIDSGILVSFSFRKVPKDEQETAAEIASILSDSKIIK